MRQNSIRCGCVKHRTITLIPSEKIDENILFVHVPSPLSPLIAFDSGFVYVLKAQRSLFLIGRQLNGPIAVDGRNFVAAKIWN